ncbi:MAG: hypothetical protein K6D95_07930, partial [Treponema sp.]|nr:hypothetical protein [Treponema sp.]
MKNRNISIVIPILVSLTVLCSFSKPSVDFENYEKFVDELYSNDKLSTFEKIHQYMYSERSCVRILITHHYKDSKIYVDERIANEIFEPYEIEEVNQFLARLGNFKEKKLADESIKNIYDIPVSDL